MNLTASSRINLFIITDFNNDVESETCGKQKVNLLCLIEFLNFVSFMNKEVYDNNLTLTYNNNLVSFTLLNKNISWSDIFIFDRLHKEYKDLERLWFS
mgnify:FL=1